MFLFKIPSLYLLFDSDYFTTQAFARIFLLISLLINIINIFKHKEYLIKPTINNCLILLFFFIQSISVINSINVYSFLAIYKDIVIGLGSFLLFYIYRSNSKSIVKVVIVGVLFSMLFQSIIIVAEPIFDLLKPIIYYKYLVLLEANLARNRIYTLSFDEAFIPLLFISYSYKSYIYSFFILLVSIISQWRIRVLMTLFTLLSSLFMRSKLLYILLIIGIGFISYFAFNVVFDRQNNTFFQRIDFQDDPNLSSITSRVNQIQFAFDNATPLGFGLGSFADYTSKNIELIKSNQTILNAAASGYIHNILANYLFETGLLGFIIFSLIILMFIKSDYEIILGKDIIKKAFVLSFWSLYIYGLFNPVYIGTYQFFFWGIRGLLA